MSIIYNMSNREYHDHDDVVSNSHLSKIAKSPKKLRSYLINAKPKPTAEMVLGSATHKQVLEKDEFFDEFALALDIQRRKDVDKATWKRFEDECAELGKEIISKKMYSQVQHMESAVFQHVGARKLLYDLPGKNEVSIFTKDPETDLETRIRCDRLLDNGLIVDLKTTKDASPKAFAKSIVNLRYHVAAAFYLDNCLWEGLEVREFVFVAVEKEAPWGVAVYVLEPEAIIRGREIYRRDLNLYADCKKNRNWPDYGNDRITKLQLPRYAYFD